MMMYFGYRVDNPTVAQLAYMAAHDVAHKVWAYRDGPSNIDGAYLDGIYWLGRLRESLTGLAVKALPERATLSPIDELTGVGGTTRQYWRTHEASGLSLTKVADQMRQLRKSGLLSGCGGVYITHERNTRGDKVYHRIRLNVCSQGRRVRRDLASYRVK